MTNESKFKKLFFNGFFFIKLNILLFLLALFFANQTLAAFFFDFIAQSRY